MENYTVILFYKFTNITNPQKLMAEQKLLCQSLNLKGRLLIALEGVNGTLEGKTSNIKKFQEKFSANGLFKDILFKESVGTGKSFSKLKVKVRDEVVTLGAGPLNIKKDTARKITSAALHELYKKDADFVVLDLRNDFEVTVGHFDKTVNPQLGNFRDLPAKLSQLDHLKNKKVITVCTGGIRCEKATPLLKKLGFSDLYQLEDGIHTYMKNYPGEYFKGSLFVFDNRMTTTVVENINREIVAKCVFCGTMSEDFYNDDNTRPSKKVICCQKCFPRHQSQLRPVNQSQTALK